MCREQARKRKQRSSARDRVDGARDERSKNEQNEVHAAGAVPRPQSHTKITALPCVSSENLGMHQNSQKKPVSGLPLGIINL